MRIEEITVVGAEGRATLCRDGAEIVVASLRIHEVMRCGACDLGMQGTIARTLQRALDGHDGTAGDVADYARIIEMLSD